MTCRLCHFKRKNTVKHEGDVCGDCSYGIYGRETKGIIFKEFTGWLVCDNCGLRKCMDCGQAWR